MSVANMLRVWKQAPKGPERTELYEVIKKTILFRKETVTPEVDNAR